VDEEKGLLYIFLADCTEPDAPPFRRSASTAPSVDRDAIHAETVRLVEAFFARHLR
jgi:hypothetical protein